MAQELEECTTWYTMLVRLLAHPPILEPFSFAQSLNRMLNFPLSFGCCSTHSLTYIFAGQGGDHHYLCLQETNFRGVLAFTSACVHTNQNALNLNLAPRAVFLSSNAGFQIGRKALHKLLHACGDADGL